MSTLSVTLTGPNQRRIPPAKEPDLVRIETPAGPVEITITRVVGRDVRLAITAPRAWRITRHNSQTRALVEGHAGKGGGAP